MGEKKQIRISVKDKIACLVDKEQFLVCGNNDYEVVFDFDSDWEGISAKTAVFVYGNTPVHKPFVGNVCEGIEIKNATLCAIGVFAGDIKTTTGATIECRQSIRDIGGVPKPPSKEVYDEIMALLDKAIEAHTELPVGGKAGQVLKKVSDKDYDTEWANDEQRDLTEIDKKIESLDTAVKENAESLVNKLDKTTEANKIYGTDANGNQTSYSLAIKYTDTGIVQRVGGGYISQPNPTQNWHGSTKEYTDKKDNEVKAYADSLNSAMNERVTDLESLTLSYHEITSTDYEKVVPADVGAPARIKMIGGATEKSLLTRNLFNPRNISIDNGESSGGTLEVKYLADDYVDVILYNDYLYFKIALASLGSVGRYYWYAQGLSNDDTITEETDANENVRYMYIRLYDRDWEYIPSIYRTFRLMVYKDESVTTEDYELVEAPEGTVFEPYALGFQHAEVERVESIGANLIPFPYREQSKTMNGVTFTVQEDGGVKAVGTASGTANFFFYSGVPTMFTVGKTYCRNGDISVSVVKTDGTTTYLYGTFEWLAEYEKVNIYIVYANTEVNETVYPMINVGSKLASYKPYKSEPIDSIAIPVEAIKARVSGYGESVSNTYYGTEHSVYNTIKFVDKTVEYHQNKSKEKSLSGNTDWWDINRESEDYISFYFPKSQTSPKMKETESAVMDCIGLPIKLWVGGTLDNEHFWFSTSSFGICVSKSTLAQHGQLTDNTAKKNAFGAWLKAKYDSGNPIKIAYELATPVVTDITDLFTEGNKLQVQQGGAIRFVNEKKMAIPNTVAFIKRKE